MFFVIERKPDRAISKIGEVIKIWMYECADPRKESPSTMQSSAKAISDDYGFAMAEALGHNLKLQSFTIEASWTCLGDTSGVAMAEALRHNTTLHSFTMNASTLTVL